MGFFSSRKAEDNDSYQVAIGVGTTSEKTSVVQVIRSRFYGKKSKEREDHSISYHGEISAAQALSSPNIPVASTPITSSPLRREAGPSILRPYDERPLPATPSKKRPTVEISHYSPSVRPDDTSKSPHRLNVEGTESATTPLSPRKNTDTVTVTLAQRLNELAVANSEGLLSDDEYRILRQNLFERFATNATVPTETSIVPASPARPRPKKVGPTGDRTSARPLSNFHVERPASISSKTSGTSGVASLFRKATGRRSNDISDTASVWSTNSNTSFFRIPRLSKKSSSSSIQTNASRSHDTITPSSRRPSSVVDPQMSPGLRSAGGSLRRLAAPPSSFNSRVRGQDTRNTNAVNIFDEDHLITTKDIMQEILNIEAESKRLMDAFNGLEVTTLAKSQRNHVRSTLKPPESAISNAESHWGLDSDGRSQRRVNLADDTVSLRSATSSVAPSLARSAYSTRRPSRTKITPLNSPIGPTVPTTSRPTSLHRKNSTSSMTSERKSAKPGMAPPVPALPTSISHGHLKGASASSVSLARSTGHLPMNTVHEDDISSSIHTLRMEPEELESELEDIRRRREEVSQRYEGRLEYLRAKLKGAQLHEKLMRK